MLIKRKYKRPHRQSTKTTLGTTKELTIRKKLEGEYLDLDIFKIQGKSGNVHNLEYDITKKAVNNKSEEHIHYEIEVRGEAQIKLNYRYKEEKEEIRINIPFRDTIKLMHYESDSEVDVKAFITNIRYKEIAGPPVVLIAKVVLAVMQK